MARPAITLRRRMQLLLVPLVVLLAANLGLDRYFADQRQQVLEVVEGRLNPARTALGDLLTALVDQETGQRGFLITGLEPFLAPYADGRVRADARLDELDGLLGADPDLVAGVQRLRSRITAWRQIGAEFELEAKRAGRNAQAIALVATGTATDLFDAARIELSDLQIQVRAELVRQETRLEALRRRLTDVRVGSVVAGLATVLVSRWVLARWVTQPVTALGASVRSVAGGHLEQRIPAPGPPELADLGRDVDAMRRRLLAEIDEAGQARAALAQRGMVVLGLRDELAPGPMRLRSGLSVAVAFLPAEGVVAGDWFDAVDLGDGRVAVVLVDVSGHGAAAAVFALKTKYLTLAALRDGRTPAEALLWVAAQLGDTGATFFTGVILDVDPYRGRLRYASAGHPPILVSEAGGTVTPFGPTGPILGPLVGDWADVEVALPRRGAITIYSDGLIDAQGVGGDEFGLDRLRALASLPAGRCDPQKLADACLAELAGLQGGRERDDITLVVIGCELVGDDDVGDPDDLGRHLEPELGGRAGVEHEAEVGRVLHRDR